MSEGEPATLEPAAPPLRILLVEDDEFDVAVFGRAFHRSQIPCEIVRCRTGEEALEGLDAADLELDLLVTDHQLPGLSGFDLCLKLLEDPPPFALVLLTGVGSEQMAIRALRAGINDYIVKDVSREYLELLPLVLPRVARRHRRRRQNRPAARREVEDGTPGAAANGGYRLGLATCADLVGQRGGRIWVEDAGSGAPMLHFSVPLARDELTFWTAAGAETELEPSAAFPGDADHRDSAPIPESADSGHVLIAHPNAVVTFVARRAAERYGCRVATVDAGRKALEALEREPFDLVLMAPDMPGIDGLETTRRIRRREDGTDGVTIFALGADSETAGRCRQAGMDGAVAPPVSALGVRAAIRDLA